MKRLIAACALAALLAVPQGVRAEDDSVDFLEMMLRSRQPRKLVDILDKGPGDEMVADPRSARRACEFLDKYARINTIASDGDGTTADIIKWFDDAIAQLLGKHADSADLHRAKAHLLNARATSDKTAGRFEGDGPWEACAELCMKAGELDGARRSEHLSAAAAYLGTAAAHNSRRREELESRALEMIQKGLEADPEDAHLKAALGNHYVQAAKAAVADGSKGAAKKALKEALEILEPPEGELPRGKKGDKVAGAYNKLLTFAARNKLRVRGDYVPKEKKTTQWILSYPRGTGWDAGLGGGRGGLFTLTKDLDEGNIVLLMRYYSWDTNYTTPDGEAGGDNASGLMKQGQQLALQEFTEIDKRKKKLGGRLNRNITKTYGYEIIGVGSDDEPQRVRGWYFKGDERMQTYAIELWTTGKVPEILPEVEYVLEGLEERPKR
jgi:tetratricopeptide (TPR) repeat protein